MDIIPSDKQAHTYILGLIRESNILDNENNALEKQCNFFGSILLPFLKCHHVAIYNQELMISAQKNSSEIPVIRSFKFKPPILYISVDNGIN